MKNIKVDKILFTEREIQSRVEQIAEEINADFGGEEVVLIGVLKGAFIFTSDIARKLGDNVTIDFTRVSSYGNSTVSSGRARILKDIEIDVENKRVVLVEDIIDTGNTVTFLKRLYSKRSAKSVSIASFLSKPSRRAKFVNIDYMGFEIPDEFVIGYGMDYAEKYRNLPYIATVKFI